MPNGSRTRTEEGEKGRKGGVGLKGTKTQREALLFRMLSALALPLIP